MMRRRFHLKDDRTTFTEDDLFECTILRDVMNDLKAGLDEWAADAMKWNVRQSDVVAALSAKLETARRLDEVQARAALEMERAAALTEATVPA